MTASYSAGGGGATTCAANGLANANAATIVTQRRHTMRRDLGVNPGAESHLDCDTSVRMGQDDANSYSVDLSNCADRADGRGDVRSFGQLAWTRVVAKRIS